MTEPLAAFAPVLRGNWAVEPDAGARAVSFDVGRGVPTELVWRVSLPADPALASASLEVADAATAWAERAQAPAQRRLLAFTTASRESGADPIYLARGPGSAEADLQVGLDEIGLLSGPVSFGVGERLSRYWEDAIEALQAAWARIGSLLSGQVKVVTDVDGVAVASTVVHRAGDAATAWRGVDDPLGVDLHERSLRSAIAARTALLRTVVTVLRGAAILATLPVLLATPAGVLLALPAAWRFVNKVLGEFQPAT